MSDLRKQAARALQDACEADGERPSYQFCRMLVEKHLEAAKAKAGPPELGMKVWCAAVIAHVVDLARPEVKP